MYYHSLNDYLRHTFGCKVYKLSIDGGMTCPNRDGSVGTRGCIFCSELGSGEFAVPFCSDIKQQMEKAKMRVAHKNKSGKYIAYFQSFTNTYAPIEHLNKIYRAAIAPDDIVALSIATRPDCLPPEVIQLLAELNTIKPIWVELGLQTIHPASAEYIRRGYPLNLYISILEECIANLPENITIHRLTGDGAKSKLIAPLWTADKKRVLNRINLRFKEDELQQGSKYHI